LSGTSHKLGTLFPAEEEKEWESKKRRKGAKIMIWNQQMRELLPELAKEDRSDDRVKTEEGNIISRII